MLIILSCCTLHPQWLSYNWKFVPFDCLHSNFPSSMPLLLVTTKLICFFHKFHLKYNWPITLLLPILYNRVIWSFYTFQNDDHNTRLLCSWDSPGKKLEWAAISFSRGTSQPRNWTQASRIAGRCFTDWATWEALVKMSHHTYYIVTDCIPFIVHFLSMNNLFCNWKFVPLNLPHLFFFYLQPTSPLATTCLFSDL